MKPQTNTLDEAFEPFASNPEYQAAYRRQKPYYDLVQKIIRLRTALGITQKELALKANTYQSRISKIETAEHDIRLSTLIEIADALDADLSIELIARHPEKQPLSTYTTKAEHFPSAKYKLSDAKESKCE